MSTSLAPLPDPGDEAARWPELAWLAVLFVAAASILTFGWLAEEGAGGDTAAFDRHVFLMARVSGDPGKLLGPAWLPETLRDLTSLGSTVVLALVVLSVVGYLAASRRTAAAGIVMAAVAGGQLLSTVLKVAFERPRPSLVPNAPAVFTASFPSGHAMLSAVTYLTLVALLARTETRGAVRRYAMAVGVCLTVLVGCSRVALGVHWPTDVLAGWIVGSAWAVLCIAVSARIGRRSSVGPA
jgi:undecaprenyl-diphosphatase